MRVTIQRIENVLNTDARYVRMANEGKFRMLGLFVVDSVDAIVYRYESVSGGKRSVKYIAMRVVHDIQKGTTVQHRRLKGRLQWEMNQWDLIPPDSMKSMRCLRRIQKRWPVQGKSFTGQPSGEKQHSPSSET